MRDENNNTIIDAIEGNKKHNEIQQRKEGYLWQVKKMK